MFVPIADSSDIGQLDVQNTLYGYAPTDVCVTLALVLVLIGGSFGSVALALRLLVTVLISLCVTYGAMVRSRCGGINGTHACTLVHAASFAILVSLEF
jgi:hypothetical protein